MLPPDRQSWIALVVMAAGLGLTTTVRNISDGKSALFVLVTSLLIFLCNAVFFMLMFRVVGWPSVTHKQSRRWTLADYLVVIPAALVAAPFGMAGFVLVKRLEVPFIFAYFVAILSAAAAWIPFSYLAHRAVRSATVQAYLADEDDERLRN